MGRSESKKAFQQSSAQSAQDQATGQAAVANANSAVSDFNKRLGFMGRYINRTYGPGGEYQRAQNTINTTAAKAGSDALGADLALHAARTGENTSGYSTATAEDRRARQRDLTDKMAQAEQSRLGQLTAAQGMLLDESKFPAGVYGSIYGTSTSGANSAMGNATNAAKTPGFWDEFLPELMGGAGAVAGGMAKGGMAKAGG